MRAAKGPTRAMLVASAFVISAAACAPPPQPMALPGRDGGPRQSGGARTGRMPRDVRMDAKRVAGKEPPTTLVAEDGTKCAVTEKRYGEIQIGEEAFCVWRLQ